MLPKVAECSNWLIVKHRGSIYDSVIKFKEDMKMPILNFARNFVTLRKKENLTQEQIAEKCGVSRQAVTKWENGNSTPDLSMISIICSTFSVTADELLYSDFYKKEYGEKQNDKKIMDKLDELLKAVKENGRAKNVDLYQEYERYLDAPEDSDFLYDAGCDEAGKGNLSIALALLDEAISRGNAFAVREAMKVYMEILDIYSDQETEDNFWETMGEMGKKMQMYGQILSDVVGCRTW